MPSSQEETYDDAAVLPFQKKVKKNQLKIVSGFQNSTLQKKLHSLGGLDKYFAET